MLSNYRPGRSLSVSAGVSGSYTHPAGVAKAIKGEVKKKHFSDGRSSFCFTAHLIEQDLF
jgi:fatty acid-binding protein DegV